MDPLVTTLGVPDGVAGWDLLQGKTAANFPALTSDPVVKQAIAYFEANAPKATTAQALMSDPRLADFVLTAYGLTSESGMTALMVKVLNSAPNSSTSFAAQMVNQKYTQIATAFNYGGTATPAQPAVASTAQVNVNGLYQQSNFSSFSGTFGGVTVSNVNLTGATTWQGLASSLQAAFQQADGNSKNITVTLNGPNLVFSDAKGRGTATGFSWTTNPDNTEPDPTASTPTNLVAGAAATAEIGGPAVTSSSFIQSVVQQYTEAQFESVLGNSSNSLREARYAQQNLPNVTNWYSVIADPALANVVQTVLGLPTAFGALNITQQNQTLSQRMNIKDFQNPQKLSAMLTQYVAMSDPTGASSSASAALQLLTASSSSSGIINMTLPSSGSTASDTYSSGSSLAILLG